MTIPKSRFLTRADVLNYPKEAAAFVRQSATQNVIAGLNASQFTREDALRFPNEALGIITSLDDIVPEPDIPVEPWTLLDLSPVFWGKANDVGNSGALLVDKSANSNDAIQETAGSQGGMTDWGNGKNSLLFDGTEDFLTFTTPIPQGGARYWAILADTTNLQVGFRLSIPGATTGPPYAPQLYFGTTDYLPGIFWGNAVIAEQLVTRQGKFLYEYFIGESTAYTRINGDEATKVETAHSETQIENWLNINTTGAQSSFIRLAELFCLPTEPSPADLALILAYLESEWSFL